MKTYQDGLIESARIAHERVKVLWAVVKMYDDMGLRDNETRVQACSQMVESVSFMLTIQRLDSSIDWEKLGIFIPAE